jgi:chromosome segregation ATPase
MSNGGWGSYASQLHDIYEQLAGVNWALRHPKEAAAQEVWAPDEKPASEYWTEANIWHLLQQRDTALEDAKQLRAKLGQIDTAVAQRDLANERLRELEKQLEYVQRDRDEYKRRIDSARDSLDG